MSEIEFSEEEPEEFNKMKEAKNKGLGIKV